MSKSILKAFIAKLEEAAIYSGQDAIVDGFSEVSENREFISEEQIKDDFLEWQHAFLNESNSDLQGISL